MVAREQKRRREESSIKQKMASFDFVVTKIRSSEWQVRRGG